MHLHSLLQDLLRIESEYYQTMRWQADAGEEVAKAEKRMRLIEALEKATGGHCEFPSDEATVESLRLRIDEAAFCEAEDPLLKAWKLHSLSNDLRSSTFWSMPKVRNVRKRK